MRVVAPAAVRFELESRVPRTPVLPKRAPVRGPQLGAWCASDSEAIPVCMSNEFIWKPHRVLLDVVRQAFRPHPHTVCKICSAVRGAAESASREPHVKSPREAALQVLDDLAASSRFPGGIHEALRMRQRRERAVAMPVANGDIRREQLTEWDPTFCAHSPGDSRPTFSPMNNE